MSAIRVRVPGSTSNIAHGFDCMGMAVTLANEIGIAPIAGDGVEVAASGAPGLAELAAALRERCAQAWGRPIPGFRIAVGGDVPVSRGLGSSATIVLGVAAACRRLAGLGDDVGAVLRLAVDWEGHPDNVVAACLGGFTAAAELPDGLRWIRCAVPSALRAAIAVPEHEVLTTEARRVLPQTLSRADAVRGWQRSALIAVALAVGDADSLRGCFSEAWHERYRTALNPGLEEARAAAQEAGAIGTFLSGSGSAVLSFAATGQVERVAAALRERYAALGIACRVQTVGFDNDGMRILAE